MTRRQVLQLVESGLSYEEAARRLKTNPGKAYLIATGLPADGGDSLSSADRERPGFLASSTQHLANHEHAESPTTKPHVLEWIKQRAHSDAQMLDAAAERDAVPGAVENAEDDQGIATVLTRDHDQVDALLKQLSTIPGHKKGGSSAQILRRQSIVDLVAVALSKHEATEQEHFWPAVRKALPDGDARADEALRQEQEGKDTLVALAKADPDSDEFDDLVEQLHLRARVHVAFEDRVLLDLQSALGDDERAQLGATFRTAEGRAPTRPHPHAPQRPGPAVQAAGAPAAVLDRARDALGERPADRRGKAPGEAEGKHEQAARARRGEGGR